jgi:hypothetical protein
MLWTNWPNTPCMYDNHFLLCFRYIQVGNAVAVPVATALGYSLGNAILKRHKVEEETIELPRHFPHSLTTPEGVPELPDNEEL